MHQPGERDPASHATQSGRELNRLATSATAHCLTGCAIGEILGLALGAALGIALAADTISITVMEIVDNAILLIIPGAMDAGLGSWLFWGALAVALAVAFVVTVPVNRALIRRGKGHAVVHQYRH
ncbi:MAG: DUF4396 domain-containing protein [Actinomycetota bacterium]|nr:DUF4396 domain-containing protein [Actinomycetota bacterium]